MARFSKLPKICTKRFFIYGIGIRHIWIDATYVDQKKLKERAEQVLLMTLNYQKRIRLTVLLGANTKSQTIRLFISPTTSVSQLNGFPGLVDLTYNFLPTYLDMA